MPLAGMTSLQTKEGARMDISVIFDDSCCYLKGYLGSFIIHNQKYIENSNRFARPHQPYSHPANQLTS